MPPESAGLLLLHDDIASLPLSGELASALTALISFGIFAALASTADNNLNIAAIGVSKLLFSGEWQAFRDELRAGRGAESTSSEQRLLMKARLLCFVIGVLSVGIALLLRDIVAVMVNAASIMMLFLPATLGALLFDHRSARAGFWSIVGGMVCYVGVLTAGVPLTSAFLPGFVASLIVYVALFRLEQRARSVA